MQPEGLRDCKKVGYKRQRRGKIRFKHRRDDRETDVKAWKFRMNRD